MTPDERSAAQDEAGGLVSLPISDLFLALGAVFLFALFALQPSLRFGGAERPLEALARGDARLDGRPPLLLLADARGLHLRFGWDEEQTVPRDAIATDEGLVKKLGENAAAGHPILLAIAEDGGESAFLLQRVLRQAGVAQVEQLRLDAGCAFLIGRQPSPASCAGALSALRGRS